jgi:rhodanese-related sulfurtransferase
MVKEAGRQLVQELAERGAPLVEVLGEEEYGEQHIAGAINIPLSELTRERAEALGHSRPIVVYCHGCL